MAQLAHEAEVQRQHTRYRIPLQCELRGTTFRLTIGRSGAFLESPGGP